MSGTYIGPFGRILPVPEDHDLKQSTKPPPSKMLARTMPPLPSRGGLGLAFGSDPTPGFTDPNRYSRSQKPNSSSRPHTGGTLPPVSDLLSPVAPAIGDVFPSSSRFGTGSPSVLSSGYPSPRPDEYITPPYHRAGANSFPGQPPRGSHMQPQYGNPVRNTPPHGMGSMQYPSAYPSTSDRPQTSWHPSPPTPSSTPSQWPIIQRSDLRSAAPPVSQRIREAASTVPPVLKVVGEKVIPGEGPCYLYEDGSHVKMVIDGEAVNAQWGVTKAGKPRKRLAVACMTCREKKIKCDPGDFKCVQCDKSGRECQFSNA